MNLEATTGPARSQMSVTAPAAPPAFRFQAQAEAGVTLACMARSQADPPFFAALALLSLDGF